MTRPITREAIKRLLASDLSVRLVNNSFNEVSAVAQFSGGRKYELFVYVFHKDLMWVSGNNARTVGLIEWRGGRGEHLEIPQELLELISEMKEFGKMSDEEASRLSSENATIFLQGLKEFYGEG